MSQGGAPLYYYRSEGQEDGPVSADKLLELFETHMITAYDEVRRDGETQWQPVQPVVTAILEQKKSGARARAPNAAGQASSATGSPVNEGARPPAREQNLLVAQRGAPTPKAAGSISDEDLAKSIAYANAEVKRGWMLRGALTFTLLGVAAGLAIHYSASLGGTPAVATAWQVDTRLTVDAAAAKMASPRGSLSGTAMLKVTRVRDLTYGSDGTVSLVFRDESSRVQADLDGPDYSELKQGVLRGRTVTFSPAETGWSATLVGSGPTARQALKLGALGFDNAAFYPARRMWPWPWQSWDLKEPEACSVLALDLEGCKAEVKMRFVGFAACGAERCARLTFVGEWKGQTEGDDLNLALSGEVLRSLSSRIDVTANGEGTVTMRRTIAGPSSSSHIELSGHVVYAQQTTPAQ